MRLLIILFVGLSLPVLHADFHWIEGESSADHEMQRHGWYDSVRKTELSGSDWLSHFGGSDTAPVARFSLTVTTGGAHHLWLRMNTVAAAASVRLNEDPWEALSFEKQEQNLNIAADGKPDLRFVAWVPGPTLTLSPGEHTLSIRFDSKNQYHGGLDVVVLSDQPFLPQGNRKPGEKTGLADPGTWAFEPDRDRFSEDSLLDLSHLNEVPAGKHGRVRRTTDGADFADGRGERLRFWGVNTGLQRKDDMGRLREHARWLAKRGVNMVRHHGHLPPKDGQPLTDVHQPDIDAAWRLVAAMRDHGIYTTLSPYWASHTKMDPAWGLDDSGNGNLTGLLFFDPKLQAAYKGWLRALLAPANPHTGVPLAKDPAVALIQIQNEDSLLFWTEGSIKGAQRAKLARLFATWLVKKYGSLDKATAQWGGPAGQEEDDFSQGIVMPHQIWSLTQPAEGALAARLADQLAFYTTLMRDWNTEVVRFLREDLGYDGLVNAGNWRTADAAKLLDAERYAYAATDVIGVNRYYTGGSHENPDDKRKPGYLVSQHDRFEMGSSLLQPWAFPLALRHVSGYPMIISESTWVPPLREQAEGPFLVAAYSALTGMDCFYWFATSDIGFGPPMGKWQLSTPALIGMFPAAALMFRRGDVAQGRRVLKERRALADVWNRKAPLLPEEAGYDPNRDATPPATSAEAARSGKITPLAYLVGPVEVEFGEEAQMPLIGELARWMDPEKQVVTSNTEELRWHLGEGYATLKAPRAAGACGNLNKAGDLSLGALRLEAKNHYASILAVSLDDRPLAESHKILVQIGTVARPHGWQTEAEGGGQRIVTLGGSPWNLIEADGTLSLTNTHLSRATVLDANGMVVREIPLKRQGDVISLTLPPDTLYLVLRS